MTLRRLWHELVRERGLDRPGAGVRRERPSRAFRTGRRSRAGMALLLVISIIALLTVVVTEVVHTASVRILLAANQRDEAKAEALAQGGAQFYRLILIASKQFEQSQVAALAAQYLGINANDLWMVIPSINTSMLRLLLVTDGDEDEAQKIERHGGMTEAQKAASRSTEDGEFETTLKKAFLDFDGNFEVSVKDEDSRVFVGDLAATVGNKTGQGDNPTVSCVDVLSTAHGMLLQGLMGTEEQATFLRKANILPEDLICNLVDWTDRDDVRANLGGRESALYDRLEPPYLPKNAPFDSVDEIRLVDGWNSDAVWSRFGRHLTIYGKGRINVNTAQHRVLEALLYSHIEPRPTDDALKIIIDVINAFRSTPVALGGGIFLEPRQFVNLVTQYAPGTVDPALERAITTKSKVFRVTSRGEVGKASVTIEVVYDFSASRQGKVAYWHIQ